MRCVIKGQIQCVIASGPAQTCSDLCHRLLAESCERVRVAQPADATRKLRHRTRAAKEGQNQKAELAQAKLS